MLCVMFTLGIGYTKNAFYNYLAFKIKFTGNCIDCMSHRNTLCLESFYKVNDWFMQLWPCLYAIFSPVRDVYSLILICMLESWNHFYFTLNMNLYDTIQLSKKS